MINHLIHFLGTEIELNGEEVADLLWLTLERQKRVQEVEITKQPEKSDSKTEDSTTVIDDNKPQIQTQDLPTAPLSKSSSVGIYTRPSDQTQASTPQGYIPLPVPDPRVLNHPLDLLKALKPLLFRVPSTTEEIINEAATAEWIAQTDLWQVITEPDLELWLDLVLVVDESVSMILWRRTVAELQQFLQHYGIFRDVRVWGMGLERDKNLYFRSAIRSHQPKELIDAQGRQLILLVSDFVDVLWHQEQILTILEQWSNTNPVAALQMLPEWLWSRSALALHTPATLCNSKGDIINRNLEALVNRLQKRRGLNQGIKLPVFSLEPEQTKRWSQMLAGQGEQGALGYVLRRDLLEHKITTTSQPTAQERVTNFSVNASPLAHKLAGLLAAAPVITMPVVRLIRDAMLPEVDQIQITEVFLGGLLKPLAEINPETDPELVHYDFIEVVRAKLLKVVPVPERDEVLYRVSCYVAEGLGKSLREFVAWLRNPSLVEGTEAERLVKPFAEVTREILGQLGEELEDGEKEPKKERINLQSFPVKVATIVFEPELPKLEFETVFVNKRGQIIRTEPGEAYYYDEPLEVGNSVGAKGLRPTQENQAFSFPPPSEGGARGGLNSEESQIQNLRMIAIPEGEFWMGSPEGEKDRYDDESPQHKVTVSSFFMSQTPITEAQWRFVANLPQEQGELNPNPANNGDDHPVVNVSWQDVIEFCARLSRHTGRNYRLPSEAQWEYACRAIQNSKFKIQNEESIQNPKYPPFHFGETITSELANYKGSGIYQEEPKGEYRRKTIPVGQFSPNAFGLYDMHGNAWEWCLDPWHNNYEGAPNDGRVWDEGKEELYEEILTNLNILLQDERNHVQRGGSWDFNPGYCRSAYRFNFAFLDSGFRVVCVPPRTP